MELLDEKISIVVVAAGSSNRMGGADKQLMNLGGRPIFLHCLQAFEDCDLVDSISVVFSNSNVDACRKILLKAGLSKIIGISTGGVRRQDSVIAGIKTLIEKVPKCRFIAVHDGARPFVTQELIERGLRAVHKTGVAIPSIKIQDTLKEITDDSSVLKTIDRDRIRAVQTPQFFRADLLINHYQNLREEYTDDAAVVEHQGLEVTLFPGDEDNIKITTVKDLFKAKIIYDYHLNNRNEFGIRKWGIGFDGHKFAVGGPIRLGGIDVPFGKRLHGHSDGDVLFHAITSAILGAVGLGEIGTQFPSSNVAFENMDSSEFLKKALLLARNEGWKPEHIDATVIAQLPRLSGVTGKMQERIAGLTGLEIMSVNIKVTSTDEMGAIGRGEGIAAQAIATMMLENEFK